MLARIRHITVDCRDPHALAGFWSAVLGFVDDPANPNEPGDPEALIIDPTGFAPGLQFMPVPEVKTGKNRIHLDLRPVDGRDPTVERVEALGGTVVDDCRRADGSGWVVMADPEGNELCVERSASERGEDDGPRDTGRRPKPDGFHVRDERSMLTGMLDWYREGVLAKVDGVAPHHARAMPLRSSTSIAGLVKHLAMVEDSWFTVEFAGRPMPAPWADVDWDADPDHEFTSAVADDLGELTAEYRRSFERSRAVVADAELDDIGADTSELRFNLRWVLVHMIEETARHLGHLDILREHLDGTTGD